jgi:hypothetical protein
MGQPVISTKLSFLGQQERMRAPTQIVASRRMSPSDAKICRKKKIVLKPT